MPWRMRMTMVKLNLCSNGSCLKTSWVKAPQRCQWRSDPTCLMFELNPWETPGCSHLTLHRLHLQEYAATMATSEMAAEASGQIGLEYMLVRLQYDQYVSIQYARISNKNVTHFAQKHMTFAQRCGVPTLSWSLESFFWKVLTFNMATSCLSLTILCLARIQFVFASTKSFIKFLQNILQSFGVSFAPCRFLIRWSKAWLPRLRCCGMLDLRLQKT